MQPLSKIIKAAYIEKTNWENSVHQFLNLYRNTPHPVTQVPPAELMFSRKLRYTIPDISSKTDKNVAEKADQMTKELKKNQIATKTRYSICKQEQQTSVLE